MENQLRVWLYQCDGFTYRCVQYHLECVVLTWGMAVPKHWYRRGTKTLDGTSVLVPVVWYQNTRRYQCFGTTSCLLLWH